MTTTKPSFRKGLKVIFTVVSRGGRSPERTGRVVETVTRSNGDFIRIKTDGGEFLVRPSSVRAA